ncbi:MAG TPA: protein kinase [Gemmatimonadales bacterium]|nr:protein kinase [Gemmatimonadales bacterium]
MSDSASPVPAAFAAALAGRYRIEDRLAQGGMATVYRARDLKHDRAVAVKVLRAELAAALGTDRFLQEIRITATLSHPHILPLYDSGAAAGQLFYVMPLVEGESLRRRLERERRLPIEEAVRLAAEVAEALAYAHARGIVHRDIKPENILLAAGHAVVADFGIARAVSAAGGARLTEPGLAVGTPSYMSPEQAAGETALDGRSDLYSLGAVLYEMLAGEPPFAGPTAHAVLARLFTEAPAPIRTRRGEVSDALDRIVRRALAREPGERFSSGSEMAEALRRQQAVAVAPPGTSVLVLPFANLSPDPDNEYFSDGMTDELISALARIEGLHVVSRTSSFAFKSRAQDIREVGERLNVQAVVEGSVRRAGDRLRITARLVNVADGFQLWSATFDRQLEDVFAIQDEIARAVAAALQVRLFAPAPAPALELPRGRPPAGGALPPTDNLEAYSLYLKGRHSWSRRTEEALRIGLGFFQQALDLDPDYALAHAGVANSYVILGFYCTMAPGEAFPAAKAAARRALELDPGVVEAQAALAYAFMYHDWDWAAAEAAFQEAIRLNPGYATAHQWYGNYLAIQGRFEAAVQSVGRAVALDPLSPLMVGALGWQLYFARRYEEAADHHRRALALDPGYAVAHLWLGLVLEQLGDAAGAVAAFEESVRLSARNVLALAMLGHGQALLGDVRSARRQLEELTALRRSRFVSAYDLAVLHLALGEPEPALEWLETGYRERTHWMALLAVDPRLDPLRPHPRFRALLDRLRLREAER